jgi:hypothetical protein
MATDGAAAADDANLAVAASANTQQISDPGEVRRTTNAANLFCCFVGLTTVNCSLLLFSRAGLECMPSLLQRIGIMVALVLLPRSFVCLLAVSVYTQSFLL